MIKYKILNIWNFIKTIRYRFYKNINLSIHNYMSISTNLEISKEVKYINIGDGITTNKNCRIAAREKAELIIGKNCTFNIGCQIICRDKIHINDNCHFGCNVILIDNDHCFDRKKSGYSQGFKTKPIIIGEGCLIGANTVILKGVEIGERCIIGAGSVISTNIASESIIIQEIKNKIYE